MKFMLDM